MAIQNQEIADIVRKGLSTFESKEFEMVDPDATVGGFGWRTFSWRNHSATTREAMKSIVEQFLNSMEYYHIESEELNTWSEGDIGLAWGVHIEDFQRKGQPREKLKTRFTYTFKKDSSGWHSLMYHRDVQPFNEDGQYPVELTKVV